MLNLKETDMQSDAEWHAKLRRDEHEAEEKLVRERLHTLGTRKRASLEDFLHFLDAKEAEGAAAGVEDEEKR